jgi:hypothetical protein
MFICHFLSSFFRNIMKFFRKSSPKIFIDAFLNSSWKSGRISCIIFWYLFDFRISTDGRVNRISFLSYWWNLQHLLVTPVCAIWHVIYINFIIFQKSQFNFGCYKLCFSSKSGGFLILKRNWRSIFFLKSCFSLFFHEKSFHIKEIFSYG